MNEYTLKELIKINNGKDYRHLNQGNIPVYGSGGIMCYVNEALYDGECILLPRKGTLDNIMYVTGKFWTVDTMYWATVNEELVDARYLYLYLTQLDLSNLDTGSTLPSMTNDTYNMVPVKLPELTVQRNVADIIFDVNNKILNNNAICSDLEEIAKLIFDYWFVQFDFPDENGKPYKSSGGKMIWNEDLKREIPEGWETTTIGEITICHDSKRIPVANKDRETMKGNIPYYGATGIMGYVNRAIFDGDYVLLAEDGSVMDKKGHPIIQRVSGEAWINNHAHVLEPKNGYSCRLLMMVLKNIPVVQIKTGSIQMKINQENMNNYKVLDIPREMIVRANAFLNEIDKKLLLLEKENQQLTSLRDFLLPMLMNGQIKIQ